MTGAPKNRDRRARPPGVVALAVALVAATLWLTGTPVAGTQARTSSGGLVATPTGRTVTGIPSSAALAALRDAAPDAGGTLVADDGLSDRRLLVTFDTTSRPVRDTAHATVGLVPAIRLDHLHTDVVDVPITLGLDGVIAAYDALPTVVAVEHDARLAAFTADDPEAPTQWHLDQQIITGVVLNVTAVGPAREGYLTIWPAGPRPLASSLNFVAGQIVANLVQTGLGSDGAVRIFASAQTHVLADVAGYYTVDGYHPLDPVRILDTRTGLGAPPGALNPGQTLAVAVGATGGVPYAGTGPVQANAGSSTSSMIDLDVREAWAHLGFDGSQVPWKVPGPRVTVAVIDSGYDASHPDLPDPIACIVRVDGPREVVPPASCADDVGHGTHISGTIAATSNNGIGVAGIAPGTKIYSCQAGQQFGATTASVLGCVDDVIADRSVHNIRVANLSLGSTNDTVALETAMDDLLGADILPVAAAGNEGDARQNFPASYDSVVSVGAVRPDGQAASFSNRNAQIELVAPGVDITSTVPGGRYDSSSGTSMSSPQVAAIAALVAKRTGLDAAGIRTRLRDAVKYDPSPAGRDDPTGFGMPSACLAIGCTPDDSFVPAPAPDPVPGNGSPNESFIQDGGFELGSPNPHWEELASGNYDIIVDDPDLAIADRWTAVLCGIDDCFDAAGQEFHVSSEFAQGRVEFLWGSATNDQSGCWDEFLVGLYLIETDEIVTATSACNDDFDNTVRTGWLPIPPDIADRIRGRDVVFLVALATDESLPSIVGVDEVRFLAGDTSPSGFSSAAAAGSGTSVSGDQSTPSEDPPTASAAAAQDIGFEPLNPARILDTRDGTGGRSTPLGPGHTMTLPVAGQGGVPTDATAVVANVTVTNPSAGGYLTLYPAGSARPLASNLNFVAGQTVPNHAVVALGSDGAISLFNKNGAVDIIVDVVGTIDGGGYVPSAPFRILDTRSGLGWPSVVERTPVTLQVAGVEDIPDDATAVVLNVTATLGNRSGYLTVWPNGQPKPVASNLNFAGGATVPNMVIAKIGDGGRIRLFSSVDSVHLVADVAGWFVAD